MKFLINVSNAMQRFANKKYIIILLIMFIFIIITMDRSPISSSALKEMSGGTGMLDMNYFGYGQQQVYGMMQSLGQAGRQLYVRLLGLDYVFAIVFMLFQSLMITSLLKRAEVNDNLKILNLLPFLRSGLDIIENCLIMAIIFNYPVQLPILVVISSIFTVLKWVVYALVIVTLLTLGVITTRKAMNFKIKIRKWSENI